MISEFMKSLFANHFSILVDKSDVVNNIKSEILDNIIKF